MKTIWDRIHVWLAANAPADYGFLRRGASEDLIQSAEKVMRLELPADVRASYRIHDGQDNEPGQGLVGREGWGLLPLQEIVKTWARWVKDMPSYLRDVPIAWIGTGDYVFLDLDLNSEEPGSLMILRRDGDSPDPFMPSFSFWLEEFADELEASEHVYSEEHGSVMPADEIGFH